MFRNSRLMGIMLAALVFVIVAAPVDAGRHWCRSDPIFNIAGTTTSVYVDIDQDSQVHVTGPIAVTLSVPPGTAVEVTYVDAGFNGFGEAITIVSNSRLKVTSRGIQVQFQVAVPADTVMPVLVTVAPLSGRASSVNGKTNTTITVNTTVASAA
ncbi:MAG: hypothetical protein ACJ789_10205 [Thermomicrobiales bacterium]